MTEQEALDYLISMNISLARGNGKAKFSNAINKAISALEKQIPKKPDYEGDGFDEDGYLIYDTWICPNCGKHYEVDYDDYNFCPECGQALDWSDD